MLVDAAAPDAQHVHVRVAGVGQQPLVAGGGDRPDERVGRDPVRPAREQAGAVEHEAEEACAGLAGVGRLVERDRAHADAALVGRERGVAVAQRDPQVVQRRLAEVVRPPQRGVREDEMHARRGRGAQRRRRRHGRAARRAQLDLHGEAGGVAAQHLDLHADLHERLAVRERQRGEAHAAERRAALAAQLDPAPEPDRRQPRPPVPAEAELRLAHPHALGIAAPLLRVGRAHPRQRRVEADGQQVLAAAHDRVGDVEDRRAEHVGVGAELGAVEVDRRERVCAVQDEPQPLVRGPGRRDVEAQPVPPLTLLHPAAVVLVAVVVRVRDAARGDQRAVHVAGHVDGDPPARVEPRVGGARGRPRAGREVGDERRPHRAPAGAAAAGAPLPLAARGGVSSAAPRARSEPHADITNAAV